MKKKIIDPFQPKPKTQKVHMPCPVCRWHKTFSGPCCPDCAKLGYPKKKRSSLPFEARSTFNKILAPQILKEMELLVDQFQDALDDLTDIQAEKQIERLRKIMGKVI